MVVEPPQQDLLRRKAQELFQCFIVIQQAVKFRMKLNVNLAQETSANNLPDQTENQVLLGLHDVAAANVDNRTTDTLGRLDDNVVVLRHVEIVQRLELLADPIHNTLVNCIRYTVVDEFGQYETVFALVKHLERVNWEGKLVANVDVAGENRVDVSGELGSLILVDGVL